MMMMMMMMILRVAGVSIDGDLFELVGEREVEIMSSVLDLSFWSSGGRRGACKVRYRT